MKLAFKLNIKLNPHAICLGQRSLCSKAYHPDACKQMTNYYIWTTSSCRKLQKEYKYTWNTHVTTWNAAPVTVLSSRPPNGWKKERFDTGEEADMLSKCIRDAGWFPTAAGSAKADLSKKNNNYYYHYTRLMASTLRQHGQASNRKVKPVWI